jgi:predicted nucleic acid-binding protein
MLDLVIADTSCLIVLTNVDELDILRKTYDRILIPPAVATEYGFEIPSWISIEAPSAKALRRFENLGLDAGEHAAIALASENPEAILIIDDRDARGIASRLGLRLTGTIGVLIAAKEAGVLPTINPILEKIQTTDFHISQAVLLEALRAAGELPS